MNRIVLTVTFLLVAFFVQAGPLWMRYPKISPDGKQIAFSYKGDIYVVPAEGGEARQLTTHPAYESYPVWSPDGKQIAFTSDRNGNFDIFVMSARGGDARQVTTNSAREIPYTFTPDGKEIIYGAQMSDPAQSALFPAGSMTELYAISVDGGRPRQILATPAEDICFFKSGDAFLYQDKKGGENEWRKHHTSSITRDIYRYDMKSGKHTRLIDRAGEDRSPVLSPDEQRVYFLSEREGSFNVYSFPVADPSAVKAETSFKTHPVRFLSIAGSGRLCFGYDGEIYVKDASGSPKKVKVDIIGDNAKDNIASLRFTSGATSATVSPDGKQVAMIIRGDVFVTSTDYTTTKQVTTTPEGEKWLSFAPDNRTIAYASERGGNWNIYTAKIAREEEVNFPNATLIEEEAVLPASTKERFAPQFSPDGKELAFIEDRTKLMVVDLKTKKVRQVADDKYQYRTGDGFTYTWSPDGKWFAMEIIGNRHDPYSDIAIVSADGKGEVVNLTNSGYFDSNPRWVLDGNAILFSSERYGMRNHASWGSLQDVMIVFMNQDAYDKFRLNKEDYELLKEEEKRIASLKNKEQKEDQKDKKGETKLAVKEKKNIEVELKGIEDRVMRLTPNSSQLGYAQFQHETRQVLMSGKRVIQVGDSVSADVTFHCSQNENTRKYLRIVGGGQLPGRFKERGETLFRDMEYQIDDCLDSLQTKRDRYALCLQSEGESFEQCAYNRIAGERLGAGRLEMEVYARSENLQLFEDGYVGVELQVYYPKPGRNPQDIYDVPDTVLVAVLPSGTYSYKKFKYAFTLTEEPATVLLKVGGKSFSGLCWLEAPIIRSAGNTIDNLAFTPYDQRPDKVNYWVGVNLVSKCWPVWSLKFDGKGIFNGKVFDRASNVADFYIPLPDNLPEKGKITLILKDEAHKGHVPYEMISMEIIEESANDFEIVSLPHYVAIGDTAGVLIEINKPGIELVLTSNGHYEWLPQSLYFTDTGLYVLRLRACEVGTDIPF